MFTSALTCLLLLAAPPPADTGGSPTARVVVTESDGAGGDAGAAGPVEKQHEERELKLELGGNDLHLTPAMVEKLSGEQIAALLETSQRLDAEDNGGLPAVLAPLGFFTCVILVVLIWLYFRTRRDRLLHETLQKMIDKGVEIPTELIVKPRTRNVDLRRGLVLTGAGVGLMVLLGASSSGQGAWAIGLIITLMGMGYLVAWWVTDRGSDATP